jgi:predicted nucleic acid-binding protein
LLPIEWVEQHGYRRHEKEAQQRMRRRDEEDWPTVALALSLGESREAAIWTNDKDFAVAGLPRITTAQLLSALQRGTRNP